MKDYTRNYLRAGGKGSFSDHYVAGYGGVRFAPELARNIVFARHDLVSDSAFNELDVILCRNVLIYFNSGLQTRVVELLHQSLTPPGVLGLGDEETLKSSAHRDLFEEIDAEHKLFRKTG